MKKQKKIKKLHKISHKSHTKAAMKHSLKKHVKVAKIRKKSDVEIVYDTLRNQQQLLDDQEHRIEASYELHKHQQHMFHEIHEAIQKIHGMILHDEMNEGLKNLHAKQLFLEQEVQNIRLKQQEILDVVQDLHREIRGIEEYLASISNVPQKINQIQESEFKQPAKQDIFSTSQEQLPQPILKLSLDEAEKELVEVDKVINDLDDQLKKLQFQTQRLRGFKQNPVNPNPFLSNEEIEAERIRKEEQMQHVSESLFKLAKFKQMLQKVIEVKGGTF